jgi:hypothetical protein
MSGTTIATAKVVAVLLADGWHHIIPGSFSVGELGFGADADLGILGFGFEEADITSPYRRPGALAGPLNSIIAVRQVVSAGRHLGQPLGSGIRHRDHPVRDVTLRQDLRIARPS